MKKTTSPTPHTLLLASQSQARFRLLQDACIPFQVIGQIADESRCDWGLPVAQVVSAIARYKMEHAQLPVGLEGQVCFVLTADTLSSDPSGAIQGKPVDHADAIEKIKRVRTGINTCTSAFCLDKKTYTHNAWQTTTRIERVVSTTYRMDIPDHWIEHYFVHAPALVSSGGVAIELYGEQFVREIHGSYSAIVGLPMFELRQALEEVGFFYFKDSSNF